MHELSTLADPFAIFSGKLKVVIHDLSKADRASQAKILAALKVRFPDLAYGGNRLNKTMLAAAVSVGNAFATGSTSLQLLQLVLAISRPCLVYYVFGLCLRQLASLAREFK